MATPKLTQIRYFYDASGNRWRYFETGKVEICRPGTKGWVDSSIQLSNLVGHADVHEVSAEAGAGWTE